MPLPLALGLVGAGATAGIAGSVFGGGGKTVQETNQYELNRQSTKKISKSFQTQTTFSPQTTNTASFNPQINLGSDSTLTKKESTTAKPAQEVTPTASIPTVQKTQQASRQGQKSSSSSSSGMRKLLFAGLLAGGGYIALKQMG